MRIDPAISERFPDQFFAELFIALGPAELSSPGDNSMPALFGRNWMLVVGRVDRVVRLYAEDAAGGWVEVRVPGHPVIGAPAPVGSRRFSLAFDQAAYPVVAFEPAEAEAVVSITRWDAAVGDYVQLVNLFPGGSDPVLLNDALITGRVAGSDVLVFFRTDNALFAYVQREAFSLPHFVVSGSAVAALDRAEALLYRYQLVGAEPGGDTIAFLSGLYPVFAHATVVAGGAFTGGSLEQFQMVEVHQPEMALLDGAFTTGSFFEFELIDVQHPEVVVLDGAFTTGAMVEFNLLGVQHPEVVVVDGAFTAGEVSPVTPVIAHAGVATDGAFTAGVMTEDEPVAVTHPEAAMIGGSFTVGSLEEDAGEPVDAPVAERVWFDGSVSWAMTVTPVIAGLPPEALVFDGGVDSGKLVIPLPATAPPEALQFSAFIRDASLTVPEPVDAPTWEGVQFTGGVAWGATGGSPTSEAFTLEGMQFIGWVRDGGLSELAQAFTAEGLVFTAGVRDARLVPVVPADAREGVQFTGGVAWGALGASINEELGVTGVELSGGFTNGRMWHEPI